MRIHQTVLAVLIALLCGCAGYNHTFFMTKSNVGLDFDAKPPTAEINVSRKESVLAPAFEGAGTPPVMASFKPEAGVGGGFHNFFVGVDQTFAGGDAAATLSRLYDSPAVGDPEPSTLILTTKPKYKSWFRRVPEPGEVRPFIFGTDTMLGLKVAWSGVGGQMPDSLKAGFNRKEFAWAPLILSNGPNGSCHVRMPSFLATIDSEQKVSTNGAVISALQYFATGKAATALAVQPEVRKAMLARLDPNKEVFARQFDAEKRSIQMRLMNLMFGPLLEDAAATNQAAIELVKRLNKISPPELEYDFTYYSYDEGNLTKTNLSGLKISPVKPFEKLVAYESRLKRSIDHLEAAILDEKFSKINGSEIPASQRQQTRYQLNEELKGLRQKYQQLWQLIDRHRDTLIEAFQYFYQ